MHTITVHVAAALNLRASLLPDVGRWLFWYELAGLELDVDPYWAGSWAES